MTDRSRQEAIADPAVLGNGTHCTVCGATPAAHATFRAHRGLVLFMQFRKYEGCVCRECGTAIFRTMQGDSLWQGWWGALSVLINPVVLLCNLGERAQVRALDPPLPGAPYLPLDPAHR